MENGGERKGDRRRSRSHGPLGNDKRRHANVRKRCEKEPLILLRKPDTGVLGGWQDRGGLARKEEAKGGDEESLTYPRGMGHREAANSCLNKRKGGHINSPHGYD